MLRNAKVLKGFRIRATDGEIGTVTQFYFDDESWAIRYLMVDTGGWLDGRTVLISPISVIYTDWDEERLDVSLTKKQVENSPDINTHLPVSRQHEAQYFGYYGYPYYWGGPFFGVRKAIRRTGLFKRPRQWKRSRTGSARVHRFTSSQHGSRYGILHWRSRRRNRPCRRVCV